MLTQLFICLIVIPILLYLTVLSGSIFMNGDGEGIVHIVNHYIPAFIVMGIFCFILFSVIPNILFG